MRTLAMLFSLILLGSCTMFNPDTGEELRGMPVELFQETVNKVAADIVLANPDGVLNWDDWASTGFILLNRVATAWQEFDAEQSALEAAAEAEGVDR